MHFSNRELDFALQQATACNTKASTVQREHDIYICSRPKLLFSDSILHDHNKHVSQGISVLRGRASTDIHQLEVDSSSVTYLRLY
jgi:hypothetical protein